jgi:hypothetical protein
VDITDEMLFNAIRKAVETGLLPRSALKEASSEEKEQLKLILKAAIDAVPTGCQNPLCLPLGGAAKAGCTAGVVQGGMPLRHKPCPLV